MSKNLLKILPLVALLAGCTFVGNSPEERRHRKVILQEEETFNNQKYQRRYAPAVQETEAYFVFTNRLSQRDTEPMDLADLGKVMVEFYGTNIAWQVVTTAYEDYSGGAPINNSSRTLWLIDQTPRTQDTAWMINYREFWLSH